MIDLLLRPLARLLCHVQCDCHQQASEDHR